MPLTKYASHTALIFICTVTIVYVKTSYYVHITQKTRQKTFIYLAIKIYVPETNIPLKCHISKLVHVKIGGKAVKIYASYELNAMINVTRKIVIHTLHIIGICPF